MKKENIIRIILLLCFISAIVFAILNYGFKIYIPSAMSFSCGAVFVCFAVLTGLEKENLVLKHSKFIMITSIIFAVAAAVLGVLELLG